MSLSIVSLICSDFFLFFPIFIQVLKTAINEISNLSRGQISAEELNRAKYVLKMFLSHENK